MFLKGYVSAIYKYKSRILEFIIKALNVFLRKKKKRKFPENVLVRMGLMM